MVPSSDLSPSLAGRGSSPTQAPGLRRRSRDLAVGLAVLGTITLILVLDGLVSAPGQALLGLATWVLLLTFLRRETTTVRAQVAVVIVFATLIEYTFSPLLEVYTYRLGGVFGVPSFVPPGHGLVYLAAVAFGRSELFVRHRRPLIAGTILLATLYALWGLLLSPRPDVLGAFWCLCLIAFLLFGPQPLLYVGAFVVVTYLEVVGTRLGVWEWASTDPTGLVSIGNPPSVAAGGYGWFDLAAVLWAPWVIKRWELIRAHAARRRGAARSN